MKRSGIGVVFSVHQVDERVIPRVNAISASLDPEDHLYVWADASSTGPEQWQTWAELIKGSNVTVTIGSSRALETELGFMMFRPGQISPGSAHFPLLQVARTTPHEFFWGVEWDVIFTGKWAAFFDHFRERRVDFVATRVLTQDESADWYWWRKTHKGLWGRKSIPNNVKRKALLPVWGASARFAKRVLWAHRLGWKGHFEALLPTLAAGGSFIWEDLAETEFVQRLFPDEESDGNHLTVRWRPEINVHDIRAVPQGTLLHPVKDLGIDSEAMVGN